MEKVHSQGKAAGETAMGGPAEAVEMARTCVERAEAQQQAMTQQRIQQLEPGKSVCFGKQGEVRLHLSAPLLIQLERA